jgi:tellurite resistance protein TerC
VASTPLSHWIGFHLALFLLLAIELFYARRQARLNRDPHHTAIACTGLWIGAALAFAVYLQRTMGSTASIQYVAGYVLEESMSVDNSASSRLTAPISPKSSSGE